MKRKRRWLFRIAFLLLPLVALAYFSRGPEIEAGSYLVLDVSGELAEGKPGSPIEKLLDRSRGFVEVLSTLRKVRHDGRIDGVVLRVGSVDSGWGQAKELRDELALVQGSGKRVVALVEGELARANKELYLASVADRVFLPPGGSALLTGLAAQYLFFGGVWEKVDLTVQVEKMREYKTAGDTFTQKQMSAEHREMAEWLLDDIDDHFVRTLAASRNLTPEEVRSVIERCPTSPQGLVEAGIADGVKSYAEVVDDLGGGERPPLVDASAYASVSDSSLGLSTGPTVAIVHAAGAIVSGGASAAGGNVSARAMEKALRSAARDDDIKAIVVRIDSPGGSAAASDQIWRSVRDAAVKKPVVASLANVAASGGYYIATGADHIVAHPTTITGSIGVVLVKPEVSGLLERIGVSTETLSRGRYARLMDLTKPLDEDELRIVRARMESIYGLFLERVGTSRDMSVRAVDRVAEGRVWTGAQAVERGLVDEFGGLRDAVRSAAAAAGIHDPDSVAVVHLPRADNFAARLLEMGQVATDAVASRPLGADDVLASAWNEWTVLRALGPGVHALTPGLPTLD